MNKILPPALLLMCLIMMALLRWAWPVGIVFPAPFNLLGAVPLLAGLFVSASAERQFTRVETNVNTYGEPGKLVKDGWFRYSRNPMYLGLTLVAVGVAILLGALSPMMGVVVFVVMAECRYIPYEEKRLLAKFGTAYEEYQSRVRRWI
jgi:protein-S-isoprenylcysteine O-methyltransferase Ste14